MSEFKKCSLMIKNCNVIKPDLSVLEDGAIAINADRIVDIGPSDILCASYEAENIIDGHNKFAMPGMVDCHTHTAQQFLRGSVVDEAPIVWIRILVPYEFKLNEQDRYHAARLACLQMIKAGITMFADSGTGDMIPIIQAVEETGIRASITKMTRDVGDFLPEEAFDRDPKVAVKKNEDLYKQFHGSADGRISIWFSVTSPMTTSPELARLVGEAARQYNTGIHIHLAEHLDEVKNSLVKHKMRPPAFLDSCGLLGPNVIAAHSIQITDYDIRLLAERGVNIIHCPCANLGNQGFPKLVAERAAGINIGLGNDGAHTANLDLFFQMQLLKYASQAYCGLPVFEPIALPVGEAFNMATINGAKALMLGDELGTLEVGKKADVVLLDISEPHISPNRNLLNTLVMVGSGRDVTDVIINGEVVLRNREFVSIDEEEIIHSASKQLQDFLSRQ